MQIVALIFSFLLSTSSGVQSIEPWDFHNNQCGHRFGEDVAPTNWPEGDYSRSYCQHECMLNSPCSAFEWYDSGWSRSKCKLVLGDVPIATSSSRERFQDAECHVKPTFPMCQIAEKFQVFSNIGSVEIPAWNAQFSGSQFPIGFVAEFIYLGLACNPLDLDLNQKIGLVDRGTCYFDVKYRHLIEANAGGMIVIDNQVLRDSMSLVMISSSSQPHWVYHNGMPAMWVRRGDGLPLIQRAGDSHIALICVTESPTIAPTLTSPSNHPSIFPPTRAPSIPQPSRTPSGTPSMVPSSSPTNLPSTCQPSTAPSALPTRACQNGGSSILSSTGEGTCDCVFGYSGDNCEIYACREDACKNGSTCSLSTDGSAICDCAPGFYNEQCSNYNAACTSTNPCENASDCSIDKELGTVMCGDTAISDILWLWGDRGESCDSACERHEGVCEFHPEDIPKSEEAMSRYLEMGNITCSGVWQSQCSFSPYILPGSGECFYVAPLFFSNEIIPNCISSGRSSQRLCRCTIPREDPSIGYTYVMLESLHHGSCAEAGMISLDTYIECRSASRTLEMDLVPEMKQNPTLPGGCFLTASHELVFNDIYEFNSASFSGVHQICKTYNHTSLCGSTICSFCQRCNEFHQQCEEDYSKVGQSCGTGLCYRGRCETIYQQSVLSNSSSSDKNENKQIIILVIVCFASFLLFLIMCSTFIWWKCFGQESAKRSISQSAKKQAIEQRKKAFFWNSWTKSTLTPTKRTPSPPEIASELKDVDCIGRPNEKIEISEASGIEGEPSEEWLQDSTEKRFLSGEPGIEPERSSTVIPPGEGEHSFETPEHSANAAMSAFELLVTQPISKNTSDNGFGDIGDLHGTLFASDTEMLRIPMKRCGESPSSSVSIIDGKRSPSIEPGPRWDSISESKQNHFSHSVCNFNPHSSAKVEKVFNDRKSFEREDSFHKGLVLPRDWLRLSSQNSTIEATFSTGNSDTLHSIVLFE